MTKRKRVPMFSISVSDGAIFIQAQIGNKVRKVAILTIVALVTGIITILAGSAEVYRVLVDIIQSLLMFTGGN